MGDLTTTLPASPCTGVCTLDDDDNCIGCGRTLDEIAAWASMPPADQRAIVASLPARMIVPGSRSVGPG